jgi:hypothetical protein
MAEDEDVDWIFDFVMEVFKSPAWEVPVMSFIDTHCAVFDSEEENKLAYSDVHGQFREMVELLLTQQLAEIGITADDFAKACEVAGRSRDVNRRVLDQILAIDDFRVFKKMMVRRNLQLQLQAVEAMKADVGTHSSVAAAVAASAAAAAAGRSESKGCEQDEEFDEEEDGAAAAADEAVPASVADAEKALAAAEAEKRQLDDAAAATLLELEMRQQQEQMEQQELAAAIEESLRLEAQRQDQQERLESKELDTALEVSAEAAGAEAEAIEAAAAAAAAEEEEEEEGKARKSRLQLVQQQEDDHPATTTPMSSPALGASSRKGFHEDPADAAAAKDEGAPGAAVTAPVRAEAKAQPKAAAPGAKAAAAAASVSAAGAKAAAPSLARVGPRQSAFLGAAPLPSIRRPAAPEDLGAMARRAERVLRTQQADLEGERARQQQLAKKQAEAAAANAAAAEASAAAEAAAQREASEADMTRRVAYLRRLRETVVATNDAKRAESASAAQKLEAKSAPDDDGGDAKGVGGGGGAGGGAAEASPADAEAESRRAAMRAALARRMKRDLLKTPAEKMERVYSGQVAALDSKLRDVESARSENKAKQDQAEAQLTATRTAQMRNARRMQQLRTALSNPIEDV